MLSFLFPLFLSLFTFSFVILFLIMYSVTCHAYSPPSYNNPSAILSGAIHMSDSESVYSDVSLDEEDEELIWRVFYNEADENENEKEAPVPEDEFSDLSDVEDEDLKAKYLRLKNGEVPDMDEDAKKRLLITSFTDDQMERFEAYRRMTVNKPGVKKLCNGILGHSISQNIAVVLAGLSKLLLGDIITIAFEVQEREYKTQLKLDIDAKKKRKRDAIRQLANGEEVQLVPEKNLEYLGDRQMPLTPEHIREAWRIYRLENSGAFTSKWRSLSGPNTTLFR